MVRLVLCKRGWVRKEDLRWSSPNLFSVMDQHGVKVGIEWWDGTSKAIPRGTPVIIRYSSSYVDLLDLVRISSEEGHLLYLDDVLLSPENPNGEADGFAEKVTEWLRRNGHITN